MDDKKERKERIIDEDIKNKDRKRELTKRMRR